MMSIENYDLDFNACAKIFIYLFIYFFFLMKELTFRIEETD